MPACSKDIDAAWHDNADMLGRHRILGRSQGCLAVGKAELEAVFEHLGEEALISAARPHDLAVHDFMVDKHTGQ